MHRAVEGAEHVHPVLGRFVAEHELARRDLDALAGKQRAQAGLGAPAQGRVQTGGRRRKVAADGLEHLADEALGRPARQPDAPAGAHHAQQLGGGLRLIRREHHADGRKRHVEVGVGKGQRFGVGLAKRHLQALGGGTLAPTLEQRAHVVGRGDVGKAPRGGQRGVAVAGGHVQHLAAGAHIDGLAQVLAHDLQGGAQNGVVARGPDGVLALLERGVVEGGRFEGGGGHEALLKETARTGTPMLRGGCGLLQVLDLNRGGSASELARGRRAA